VESQKRNSAIKESLKWKQIHVAWHHSSTINEWESGSAPVLLSFSFPVFMTDEWHMDIKEIKGLEENLDKTSRTSLLFTIPHYKKYYFFTTIETKYQ
jgi:hypothetical protein